MRIDFSEQRFRSSEIRQWVRLRRTTRAVAGCLVVAGISVITADSIESADQDTLDALATQVQQYTASEPMAHIDNGSPDHKALGVAPTLL